MDSIGYYDKNSQEFFDRTINADVQPLYRKFLAHIPKQGLILDAGCGVGRDAKFFLSKGYDVVAFDGSLEMVKLASNLLERDVLHMYFEDMHFSNAFDAIWANASLLHVPYEHLTDVFHKLYHALLPAGIFYASFKYGNSKRAKDDRFFYDMNETKIEPYLKGMFQPIEIWKSDDTRGRGASEEKCWLNMIVKRIN